MQQVTYLLLLRLPASQAHNEKKKNNNVNGNRIRVARRGVLGSVLWRNYMVDMQIAFGSNQQITVPTLRHEVAYETCKLSLSPWCALPFSHLGYAYSSLLLFCFPSLIQPLACEQSFHLE